MRYFFIDGLDANNKIIRFRQFSNKYNTCIYMYNKIAVSCIWKQFAPSERGKKRE